MVMVPTRPKSQAITATPSVGPALMLVSSTDVKRGKRGAGGRPERNFGKMRGGGVKVANPRSDCCFALVGRCRAMDGLWPAKQFCSQSFKRSSSTRELKSIATS